ncbi:hypothetical protein NE652_11080, partial [Bifidobacterium pseudocatenulatum]|nr:hypothetical protein [Bifidobacterium pseudocatenulatum]
MTPAQQIDAILKMMPDLYQKRDRIYQSILKDLKNYNIRQLQYTELNEEQRKYTDRYFKKRLHHLLSPQIIDLSHP